MTEVAFHFGAPDKVRYAERLLRKATRAGSRLWVLAPEAHAALLDASLWGVAPTAFIPHCLDQAPASVRQRSAVVLAHDVHAVPEGMQVLVNLTDTMPEGFERFSRVIEVVSTEESDRQSARERWKQYTRLGYSIQRHDLQLRADA